MHTTDEPEFFWDPRKASANIRKHGVRFADAADSLMDPACLVMEDAAAEGEQRLLALGMDAGARLLVTEFTQRGNVTRILSSRLASPAERLRYRGIP